MAPPLRSRVSARALCLVGLVLGIFLTLQALVMAVVITCTDLQWQWPWTLSILALIVAGIALIAVTARGAMGGPAVPIVRVPWPDDEQPAGDGESRKPG